MTVRAVSADSPIDHCDETEVAERRQAAALKFHLEEVPHHFAINITLEGG